LRKQKARGVQDSSALWKSNQLPDQGLTATGPSGSGFMVGIRPRFGLPTEPWTLAIRMVDSEVVPQQSFFGQ
jgi:hypothetical protein